MKKFNHGGNVYSIAREKNIPLSYIHDFSANINAFGPSKRGLLHINKALPNIVYYPDASELDAKKVIAETYHIKTEQIILGNGASELIYIICQLANIKNAVIAMPSFSEYKIAASIQNIPVNTFLLSDENYFALTKDSYKDITFDQSLVFLGNPNNPTGQILSKDVLLDILEKNKNGIVVVDESFIDFVGENYSYRSLINEYDNLIILHSFTKFYAIPGLRCGAAYACPNLINKLEKLKPTWSVNTLAQAYLQGSLIDQSYYYQTQSYYKVEKARLESLYNFLPSVKFISTQANFFLLEIENGRDMNALIAFLDENKCFVRNCANFEGLSENYIRVAIKSYEENNFLFKLLKEFLND